jgi:two-component system CheB/CheR fusion protein
LARGTEKTKKRPGKTGRRNGAPAVPRPKPASPSADIFPIVGIGASAGGLEAFTSLLTHLPRNPGMAFVLVQHLDPKRDSMLTEILTRSSQMPIHEVRDRMPVRVDEAYVIPANADIAVVDGSFRVSRRNGKQDRFMPIDSFFRSLAQRYRSRAIGIVLSGTLSDGALGLRAIKAEGGVTFAQDERSAKFPEMPRAAIAAGSVDFIYPPEKIASELVQMGKHPYIRPAPQAPEAEPRIEGPDHQRILALLRTATGVDFSGYRQTTVKRRIARRMALRRVESLRKYYELLRKEPAEVHALHEDILITVTAFFRDPDVFQSLKKSVFPSFRKDRGPHAPIRIWIPGCSTGEEVYSIAIALFEVLQESDRSPPVQIFATDVSEAAIDKARAGVYLDSAVVDVSPERVRRFFVKTDGGWQISKTIRDVCVFAHQNITSDPPFSNLDLISCRNLLIYLEPSLQKRVLPIFHYGLRPMGFLLLGNAESITGFGDLFVPLDRNHRIFAKRPGSASGRLEFGRRAQAQEENGASPPPVAADRVMPIDLQREADRLVIGRYGPAGVLINDAFEILQFRGRTSPYLEAASGAASLNILKMAREGLLVELRSSILKARKTGKPVRRERLHVRQDGSFRDVNLEVVPIRQEGNGIHHFLVLFEDAEHKARAERASAAERKPRPSGRAAHETIVKLEQELTATKDYLQSIIEEQEASNEELKSANEEILSANEELQSTNEELETAKEELQSTNEELTTVNEELQNRNLELSQVNSDMQNLLVGTEIAIVMLGSEGRLRRYTPQAGRLMNLIPADVGRRISDIKPNLKIGDLDEVVRGVMENAGPREREVQDEQGNWFLMRAKPYRTLDNRIDGAVISFYDIDPLKRSLEQVNRARDYAEALVETVRESLIVLDGALRVRAANHSFYRSFQTAPTAVEGRDFLELWRLDAQDPHLRERLSKITRETPLQDYEIDQDIQPVGHRALLLNARRVRLPGEAAEVQSLILLAIDDVTERERAETALRASESRYRRIFETAREGIWILDGSTGEIIDANPYLLELLGYRRDDLVGKKPWESGVFENASLARQRFRATKANGFSFEPEVPLRTRDARRVVVETITNTYEVGGRTVMQGNIRDISERVRLQDQLRQVQKLDSIGRLAGGIAHDFNNLLNIISAHLSLLRRPSDETKRAESAAAIQKAVERGTAVVRQLLTFARKGDASFESTDANTVVREVASMLRETFPKQTRVAIKLKEELPAIHADPNQIHQAVLNLAVNARDAMPDGGTLTLGTDDVDGDVVRRKFPEVGGKRYVELCVADTGTGMDEDTRRRIFEPFFSTKGSGGQGMGLAVVYGIVNSHHGMIDLESDPGKGTTFRIYLPASDGAVGGSADPDSAETKTPVAPEEQRASGRIRTEPGVAPTLLLVEDEEALLGPVRTILEEEGYAVLTASDGLEAVRMHAEHAERIAAVLLDLSLPRLGGWQAFLRMRERDPHLRCVVASGNIDPEQRAAMRKQGVNVSIRKPYGSAEMLRAVRQVLADA